MTGQLILVLASGGRKVGGHPTKSMIGELPNKTTRVIFEFKNGDQLFFNDQRKFGWIKLVDSDDAEKDPLIARLGPEPLSKHFDLKSFEAQLKKHPKSSVKAVILDQSTVSGIGNIYADEALHLAKIHPQTPAGSLEDIAGLRNAIRQVIRLGIKHGGTTIGNYLSADGSRGDYLSFARVFNRQSLPCKVCQTPIVKIRVAGRGTHLCPSCQKLP